MLQNLKAVQIASMIFFALSVVLRIFYTILPESLTHARNFPEFNLTNWLYIAITPVFILASNLLISYFNKRDQVTPAMSGVVSLFSLYIISAGLISTILSTHDPKDGLIFYLTALIFVGVIFLFEYEDTIMITIVTEILFSALLFYCNLDYTSMLYNQIASVFLLAGFFFTSRYAYSFRATFYLNFMEIRDKTEELEKASNFKNEVLGMVAHDLRNPIGAIESVALIMELEELDEDTTENMNMIKASCIKARSIINDLIEVARNDNSNDLVTQKMELNELLKGIINEWKFRDHVRNELVLISSKSPLYAAINVEKFIRVIDNLISNAIKFSKDGDKIEIYLNAVAGGVQIDIKDYGLGIPQDMLPYIFERFSKAGRKGTRGELSTGLGLSIVRQIVEKHKGKIEVESQENKGSTFKIRLPQAV